MNKINNIKELRQLLNVFELNEEVNFLTYGLSNVRLCKVNNIDELKDKLNNENIDEVLEMRIFNLRREIFLYRYIDRKNNSNNQLTYTITEHNNDEETISRIYELVNKFNKFNYSKIKVIEYIDYEDNLAYVKKTCLLDIVGGEQDEQK